MSINTDSKNTLTITRPDDWHVHLRDGEQLKDTVRDISRYMGRANHQDELWLMCFLNRY
jgi:dihydroorotase